MATTIIGIKAGMQEPKQTIDLGYDEIFDLLGEKYKMGKTGKEYNLITKYTNSIINAVHNYKTDELMHKPVIIKFSHIRLEWIKAAFHFTKNGIVKKNGSGVIITETT